jgi:transposase
MHKELKRKGVTKQLLWEEYKQIHGDNGYQYSQYCQHYRDWVGTLKRSMRQIHKAGEKLFIDYCGPTIPIVNPDTGEYRNAQIFVACWGASTYTYAEASWSQKKADWIEAHVNAFTFFGGVPEILVPDNLKSATTKACRYEPEINASYQHMADHYKTVIIPARPYKPKDKAKAENAVLIVERWIMARLRHMMFFTLSELNRNIRELLSDLNQRPFQKLPGSRLSQFELLDKPAMRALPATRYEYVEFKLARVNIDYHIEYDKRYYSVPHHLVKHQVEVQAARDGIAVFFKGKQIARHARGYVQGGFSTEPSHMPESHRKHQEWTPERLRSWATNLGPNVLAVVELLFARKKHPEQAYRSCLGLLNLSRQYDTPRLERACHRAKLIGSPNLKSIKSILKQGIDQLELPLDDNTKPEESNIQCHENIRGAEYYH